MSGLNGGLTFLTVSGNQVFDTNAFQSVNEYNATTGAAGYTLSISGANGVSVANGMLYVTTSAGVSTYNALTGMQLSASLIPGLTNAGAGVVSGTTLYVSHYDMSLGQQVIGEYSALTGTAINADYITGVSPNNMSVSNGRLYTADGNIEVYDVSNPTTATLVTGNLTNSGLYQIFVDAESPLPVPEASTWVIGVLAAVLLLGQLVRARHFSQRQKSLNAQNSLPALR